MSKELVQHIRKAIDHQDGFLSFDQFMNLALYEPGLGYYSRPEMDFAQKGDFTTAPETSPLFGQCIAKQCAQVLAECPQGVVFELGAGSGKMAAAILQQLAKDNQLPHEYWILECSGSLRALQKETIERLVPDFADRVHWLDRLPNVPFSGVIVGNEVLDAIAVQVVCKSNQQWMQRGVGADEKGIFWAQKPATGEVLSAIEKIESEVGELPNGYCTEINLAIEPWLESVTEKLEKGLVLLIDYGYSQAEYYRPDRMTGTLMCYHQHQGHDNPFVHIGEQDITAHVDFTALAEAALKTDLEVAGYTTQMMFLAGCGIDQLAMEMSDQLKKRNELMALTHPTQMGEVFKVMGMAKEVDADLMGFSLADMRHLL